jgi:hypothetical protein
MILFNRFNGLVSSQDQKPLKRLEMHECLILARLKPGENERD